MAVFQGNHLVPPPFSCTIYSRRVPLGTSYTDFLWAGCSSCHPANSVRENLTLTTHTTVQPFYGPFPGPLGCAGARREPLDFMAQGKFNRGRHINHLAGRHSIRTNQCAPPPSPISYRLDALPAAQPTVSKH